MAIKITINQQEQARQDLAREAEEKKPIQAKMELKARKTPDGNVMIFDHLDIDIVLMPAKKKVVAFPKQEYGENVYNAQSRMFDYLVRKGVITFDSVQGGNIFSSIEGKIVESKDYNTTQLTLFAIGKFIEEEKPAMEYERALEAEFERRLAQPLESESTEFDPRRHAREKGSIRPGVKPYGLASAYRF
jgi:hypothetical protein